VKSESPIWSVLLSAVGASFVIVTVALFVVSGQAGESATTVGPDMNAAALTDTGATDAGPKDAAASEDATPLSDAAPTDDAADAAPSSAEESAGPASTAKTKTPTKPKTPLKPKKKKRY
jgi:hypothetical protein